jgi:hypothetical protein
MSEEPPRKKACIQKPRLAAHPPPAQSLEALQNAWPIPDVGAISVKIMHDGKATFNGDDWITVPVVAGLQCAPADLSDDVKHFEAGKSMDATLYQFSSYKGDPNILPKAQMVVYPTPGCTAFLTGLRAKYIEALIKATIEHGQLPGDHKPKHVKMVKALIKEKKDVGEYIRSLADADDSAFLNWPLRQCERTSTPTVKVMKLCANLNIVRPIGHTNQKPDAKVGEEFGPDIQRWVDSHPGVCINAPPPMDLACNPISWATLRGDRPDNVPVSWTGIIREFGISAQPPMDGKIFFNCTFAKTWQISSVRTAGGGASNGEDMTRFFKLDEEE